MGLTYSKIKLSNPRLPDLKPVELNSLVDTGALMLCIPQSIAFQLELAELDKRPVIADGTSHQVPYLGPVRVDFENRFCFVGALVIGDETLLGAVPMDGLSLNITQTQIDKLKALFPEAVSEGKVDWERLRLTLGEDINLSNERYVLNWAGKSDAFRALQTPTSKTLTPAKDESVDWDTTQHIFIEGENLEVLKVLQKSYFGQVKMIYIDPPYNTGNDSFIYPDKFSETKDDYLRRVGDKDQEGHLTREGLFSKNTKENGQYHSNWLSMMYPRLFLAKNLLRQDGVIFVSIDDNEVHNLRLLMNEVFGEENFVASLAVQVNPRGRHLDQFIAKTHESVVVFVKDSSNGASMFGLEKEGSMVNEYDRDDNNGDGPYRLLGLRNRNQAFNPLTRPKLYYPLFIDPENGKVSLTKEKENFVEVLPDTPDGIQTCWTWGKDKVTKENHLLVGEPSGNEWRIFRKDHLFDEEGNSARTLPKSLWFDKEINNDYGKYEVKELFGASIMDFPKSPYLISKIIGFSAKEDDLILDFFAGSGTTAHAVMQLNAEDGGNRKYICVQLPEPCDAQSEAAKAGYGTIAEISKERIRRAGKKVKAEIAATMAKKQEEIAKLEKELGLEGRDEQIAALKSEISNLTSQDTGFKVLKLTESNFKQWRKLGIGDAEELERQMALFIDPVKEGATEEGMVYELLLKSGLGLNSVVERVTVNPSLRGTKQSHPDPESASYSPPSKGGAGGGSCHVINQGELVLLLEQAGKDELAQLVAEVVKLKPRKVVALDRLFEGNDQLKTNTMLQMKDAGIEFRTI